PPGSPGGFFLLLFYCQLFTPPFTKIRPSIESFPIHHSCDDFFSRRVKRSFRCIDHNVIGLVLAMDKLHLCPPLADCSVSSGFFPPVDFLYGAMDAYKKHWVVF